MITYVKGNLFSSPAQVLVNTVNTVGVMGKGIAKEFKAIYPEMFREYQALCEDGKLKPGVLFLYRTKNKWVLNFPTKRHWRQKSRVEDIEAGLVTFADQVLTFGVYSFAFPQLGCGNGELDWESEVRPLMERHLDPLPIDVYIHTYDQQLVPEHRDVKRMREWLRNEPRSLAFAEFWSDVVRSAEGMGIARLRDCKAVPGTDEAEEVLEFVRFDGSGTVTRGDCFDLWQRLRSTGLIGRADLPEGLSQLTDDLFQVLASLVYVEEASFAQYDPKSNHALSTLDLLDSTRAPGLRLDSSLAPVGPEPTEFELDHGGAQPWLSGMTAMTSNRSSRRSLTPLG